MSRSSKYWKARAAESLAIKRARTPQNLVCSISSSIDEALVLWNAKLSLLAERTMEILGDHDDAAIAFMRAVKAGDIPLCCHLGSKP